MKSRLKKKLLKRLAFGNIINEIENNLNNGKVIWTYLDNTNKGGLISYNRENKIFYSFINDNTLEKQDFIKVNKKSLQKQFDKIKDSLLNLDFFNKGTYTESQIIDIKNLNKADNQNNVNFSPQNIIAKYMPVNGGDIFGIFYNESNFYFVNISSNTIVDSLPAGQKGFYKFENSLERKDYNREIDKSNISKFNLDLDVSNWDNYSADNKDNQDEEVNNSSNNSDNNSNNNSDTSQNPDNNTEDNSNKENDSEEKSEEKSGEDSEEKEKKDHKYRYRYDANRTDLFNIIFLNKYLDRINAFCAKLIKEKIAKNSSISPYYKTAKTSRLRHNVFKRIAFNYSSTFNELLTKMNGTEINLSAVCFEDEAKTNCKYLIIKCNNNYFVISDGLDEEIKDLQNIDFEKLKSLNNVRYFTNYQEAIDYCNSAKYKKFIEPSPTKLNIKNVDLDNLTREQWEQLSKEDRPYNLKIEYVVYEDANKLIQNWVDNNQNIILNKVILGDPNENSNKAKEDNKENDSENTENK